jgi:hypothetical protein
MTRSGRQFGQRLVAAFVIVALLTLVGVPVAGTVFLAIVVYFVWRGVQQADRREVTRIFEFYVSANDVLCHGERGWYGFEIVETIDSAEDVLHSMPDPPILVHFALGALYHRAGQYHHAVEELSYVTEAEMPEQDVTQPSLLLRRYVSALRQIERSPESAPQTLAALRSLERSRREGAASLLADSRARLQAMQIESAQSHSFNRTHEAGDLGGSEHVSTPPRPISEVLHDVYEQDYEN